MLPNDQMIGALRGAAAVTRMTHACAFRLVGPGALDLLDAACTSRLFVREGQILQTLLLDGSAGVLADACVGQDEDGWLLLVEGPTRAPLAEHLDRIRRQRAPLADVSLIDLIEEHELWSIDGPFAWEVTSALLGPQVLGAPYLSFLRLRDVMCFRLGKTGEYGYLLMVPRALAPSYWQELFAAGAPLGLVEADIGALDQCALENWHFFIRALAEAEGHPALTPLELQLQWRVDPDKDFEGVEAYRECARTGPAMRLTCFVSKAAVRPRDSVVLDDRTIGSVLACGWSSIRGDYVGWALLEAKLAWPGIRRYRAQSAGAAVEIETRSPPLLDNRSLFIDPHRHSYRTRDEHVFPPVVPP